MALIMLSTIIVVVVIVVVASSSSSSSTVRREHVNGLSGGGVPCVKCTITLVKHETSTCNAKVYDEAATKQSPARGSALALRPGDSRRSPSMQTPSSNPAATRAPAIATSASDLPPRSPTVVMLVVLSDASSSPPAGGSCGNWWQLWQLVAAVATHPVTVSLLGRA
jgi:hypothetical protein